MAGGILGGIIGAVIPGLPSIAETAKILVERLVPDPAAREEAERLMEATMMEREARIAEAVAAQNKAQIDVNLAEAQGNDRFSSRWRPAMGWVCVAGFLYNFVMAPVITWITVIIGAMVGASIPIPPTLSTETMLPVLLGMLGIGGMRTYERTAGVAPTTLPPGRR